MLDHVVVLGDPSSAVAVELDADAPVWQVRLKLWDARGTALPYPFEHRNEGAEKCHWQLASVRDLHGHTLTWSIRMSRKDPSADASFAMRIRIMEGRDLLPGADFVCTGPLDEFEERTGQFHFEVR